MNIDLGLLRLAMTIGVGENNPRRAAALLLTLGRIGSVSLADDGLEEGLGSWFRARGFGVFPVTTAPTLSQRQRNALHSLFSTVRSFTK